VSLTPGGAVYGGISLGVVSTTHPSTGVYTVTFNRNIRSCATVGGDVVFSGTRDISPDVTTTPMPTRWTCR